jgi:pimeloyl-ACP methyl ester carboxylesterase
MDAAGSEQAVVIGVSEGVPMSILFAATYPDRVKALVLYGGMARTTWAEDYPWATPADALIESSRAMAPYINDGAMTAWYGKPQLTHTFSNLVVSSTPTSAALNVGMGDGEIGSNGAESAMRFAGTAVTPANLFFGADGPSWDDDTINIPTTLLPSGVTSRTNGITRSTDDLTWAFAALSYQLP